MSNEQNERNSHADDVVAALAYEVPLPPRKEFLPWHRPRKQFVRERQWLEQIDRLLDDYPRADRTLKYFGLPGVDLLDLRYFHARVCEPRKMALRFLGFNTAASPVNPAQTELNISLDEVRRLPLIDPQSDVVGDDVRGIAAESSVAWKRTLDLGPFDVVNLDLCDGFGSNPPGGASGPTHFDALGKLMSLQARSKTPWLLLLTTRAGHDHVHPDVFERFVLKYGENLTKHRTFREASIELFQIETVLPGKVDGDRVLPLFLSGLCKWLLNLALAQQPPTSVEVKSVIGYRVDRAAAHEDLVSIALRFSPVFTPAVDTMKLTQPGTGVPDECALAVKAIRRVAKIRNADDDLREDADLNAHMIDETASLLAGARYDAAEYRKWVAAD